MKDRLTCIVCPRGCELAILAAGVETRIEGAGCRRGLEYAEREIKDPRRVLTSTVRTNSPRRRRLAVKTSAPIPLPRLLEAAKSLDAVEARAPLRCGDILARDWLGLGVDLVATDDLE